MKEIILNIYWIVEDLVGILSFLLNFILPFIILVYGFTPKIDVKKIIGLFLIALIIIPINFIIFSLLIVIIGAEGPAKSGFYNYSKYFLYVYWINLLIIGFLIYRKKYVSALIVPKLLEIICIVIVMVLRF